MQTGRLSWRRAFSCWEVTHSGFPYALLDAGAGVNACGGCCSIANIAPDKVSHSDRNVDTYPAIRNAEGDAAGAGSY